MQKVSLVREPGVPGRHLQWEELNMGMCWPVIPVTCRARNLGHDECHTRRLLLMGLSLEHQVGFPRIQTMGRGCAIYIYC